jgi:predicted metal-dependent enzyme (double-stranded beta helix superfamily)
MMEMDAFFTELGARVLERWKRENFSLEKFPEIARTALEERLPSEHVNLSAFIEEFLLNDDQPLQTQSGFGQPELVAYDHPRFYIQILVWMDGTTDIHQHEFSGAFHVMSGSSIHAHYGFEKSQAVTPHLHMGKVSMQSIELLETGRTVPIISGPSCIHSLFHLDTPSVTVVVRTQNDPGMNPQFNYLPPHMAVDPMFHDTLTMRRKQLLDLLAQMQVPGYGALVLKMLEDLDFERGFYLLQHCMSQLGELDNFEAALGLFERKHGQLAVGVSATLEEGLRRDNIKNMRGAIAEPEHRFFLALLMNVSTRADLLTLVAQRFPDEAAVETVMRWALELEEYSEAGLSILDAVFPEDWEIDGAEHSNLFQAALRHFMLGGKKLPKSLSALSKAQSQALQALFAASSLRVLVV